MRLDIINLDNEKQGDLELDASIFGVDIRKDILARVVRWQLAKRRSGNHKVKTRGEVKHSTKKPFKQKGTGRARQGMTSVSHMRGGGVVFGPVVRDHSHDLPKKVRRLGLKSALSSKFKDQKLIIMDDLAISNHKTSEILEKLTKLNLKSALFVDKNSIDNNFKRAISNLAHIDVLPCQGLNVYDILKHDCLVVTKEGIIGLQERLYA